MAMTMIEAMTIEKEIILSLIDNFKSLSLALYNRVRCLLTLSVSRLVGPGARRRGRRRLAVLGGRGLLGLPRPLLRPRTRPRTGAPAQETLSQTNRYTGCFFFFGFSQGAVNQLF